MLIGTVIDVDAEADLGVAARILDLFAAQNCMPRAFSFQCADDGRMTLRIDAEGASELRLAILYAKLARVSGVYNAVGGPGRNLTC